MQELQLLKNKTVGLTKAEQTAKIWLTKYENTAVCKFSDCYPSEENKTLKKLIKSNLDKPTKYLIYDVVLQFAASYNLTNNFREDQIMNFVMDLFLYHSELTVRDIKFFLQQVKIGAYGQNYNRLDAPLLHGYLNIYKENRLENIEAENISEQYLHNSNQKLNILENRELIKQLAPILNKIQEQEKPKTEIQIKAENEVALKIANQQATQLRIHKEFCELHRLQGGESGTMFVKYKGEMLNFESFYNVVILEF